MSDNPAADDGYVREPGSVLVVIPTYNERDNLGPLVARIHTVTPFARVLVVDDNSPDGTGAAANGLADTDGRVHVLHREGKRGLGAAYVAGFRWALAGGYDIVVEMDADGSHHPEELPRLLDALRESDLALGSRWVPGGRVTNWPWTRVALSRGANAYARFVLGIRVADATGGYRAYRSAVLAGVGLDDVRSQGYCFQVDLVTRALTRGFDVSEVPITFTERRVGASKMDRRVAGEALWRIAVWGMRRRLGMLAPSKRATVTTWFARFPRRR